MATAVLEGERAGQGTRAAGQSGMRKSPLRCVLMDDSSFDRRVLRRVAEGSRYRIDLVETASIGETRRALATGAADLLLLDYRVPDGDGIAFARELSRDERLAGIPVVVVTGDGSEQAAVQAIRSGAADYLAKNGLTTDEFDQAIENALRRAPAGSADQAERISELTAENTALRRTALSNMRLLKGQVLPLLSFAWRMLRGDSVGDDARRRVAQELGRITRSVLGLIDDTVVLGATFRNGEVAGPVDLGAIVAAVLEDEGGEIRASRARVRVGRLPVLKARASQVLLLLEELLLTAIRSARPGRAPEIDIGSGTDPDGNPIVWLNERSSSLTPPRQAVGERFGELGATPDGAGHDEFAWSLCQRIVEKNGGEFRIARSGTVRLRFPKSMLAGTEGGPAISKPDRAAAAIARSEAGPLPAS